MEGKIDILYTIFIFRFLKLYIRVLRRIWFLIGKMVNEVVKLYF